jgi:hypothetical protein
VGDGGYYYVPADYVRLRFTALEFPEFDTRRGAGWQLDQMLPGAGSGLAVVPRQALRPDARVRTDLSSAFEVQHPSAQSVRLTVRSDRDGLLYDGLWRVANSGNGQLFGTGLPVSFADAGTRRLSITARYGPQTVTAQQTVTVVNTAPEVALQAGGAAAVGEDLVVSASIVDPNEPDPTALCATLEWVLPMGATATGSGCQRVLRFSGSGPQYIGAKATDREGDTGMRWLLVAVAPAPANPYPRITGFQVYSRDRQLLGGLLASCVDNAVPSPSTIDLRDPGCRGGTLNALLSRYYAQVAVDNPAGEALLYDWSYTIDFGPGITPQTFALRRTVADWDLSGIAVVPTAVAFGCTVDVTVVAPDAARNKSVRVFSGRCINPLSNLR